jgi:hypothetical protein
LSLLAVAQDDVRVVRHVGGPVFPAGDLGESLPFTRIVTSPEFRDVAYGYKIELSDDGQTWRTFADRTANRSETPGDGYVDAGERRGRQVRITINFASGNWAGLYNFQVFSGDQVVSLGKPVTASSTRGKGSEPGNAVDGSTGPQLADFVEGSYMIKRGGTYYLLYSSGALHDGSYSVHYAMGKQPFGPFTTPADNVVLRLNKDLTTTGPGHNSVLKFKDQYYIVYHQHNQPHEDAGGVFSSGLRGPDEIQRRRHDQAVRALPVCQRRPAGARPSPNSLAASRPLRNSAPAH